MGIDQKESGAQAQVDDRYDAYELYEEYTKSRSAESTQNKFRSGKKQFESFLSEYGYSMGEVGRSEANEFFDYLKNRDIAETTAFHYASDIIQLFGYLVDVGVLEWNPIATEYHSDVFDADTETIKARIHDIDQLRGDIKKIYPVETYAMTFTALKTGGRKGEVSNLDLQDVNIDHPISDKMPAPRPEIEDIQDVLFIDSSISKGDVVRGDVRKATNKRKKDTIIPIDSELKQVLVWNIAHLLPSNPSTDSDPLFRINGNGKAGLGARVSGDSFYENLTRWAEEHGWGGPDSDEIDGVTPHWCRHWFTTHLRNRVDPDELKTDKTSESVKMYVKGLRGDTGSDVIDTYTHNYDEKPWLREAYVNNIPSLLK